MTKKEDYATGDTQTDYYLLNIKDILNYIESTKRGKLSDYWECRVRCSMVFEPFYSNQTLWFQISTVTVLLFIFWGLLQFSTSRPPLSSFLLYFQSNWTWLSWGGGKSRNIDQDILSFVSKIFSKKTSKKFSSHTSLPSLCHRRLTKRNDADFGPIRIDTNVLTDFAPRTQKFQPDTKRCPALPSYCSTNLLPRLGTVFVEP